MKVAPKVKNRSSFGFLGKIDQNILLGTPL